MERQQRPKVTRVGLAAAVSLAVLVPFGAGLIGTGSVIPIALGSVPMPDGGVGAMAVNDQAAWVVGPGGLWRIDAHTNQAGPRTRSC